ncbi:BolA/IbaG family iron-sulfur metabolism protein [Bartonella sp. DGB1]|uniref:BolA/IbaG family iron-sulfur metabolism protein n=1 Tax=Bartonella sp. DGB1 TaxID=3239807 RepID=UPI003524B364
MAMEAHIIEKLIREAIPDSKVIIKDLAGDGEHYVAEVISETFRGKTRLQQHKMVYNALQNKVGTELHALAVQTKIPE